MTDQKASRPDPTPDAPPELITDWPTYSAAQMRALRGEPTNDKSQIELLADFIMTEIAGEPSQSEGAGDCAIRLLKQYRAESDHLRERATLTDTERTAVDDAMRSEHPAVRRLLRIIARLTEAENVQS